MKDTFTVKCPNCGTLLNVPWIKAYLTFILTGIGICPKCGRLVTPQLYTEKPEDNRNELIEVIT